jgi:peptide subunit release factor RF-3
MPIDEAEGLGTNFDMLYDIAQKHDYQIITFAINPLGRYNDQYIYILHRNTETEEEVNYTPMAIRSKLDIK